MSGAWLLFVALATALHAATPKITADGEGAKLAFDGERYSTNSAWRGSTGNTNWTWTIDFGEPRVLGSILQITGDHDFVFRNAPRDYRWRGSADGTNWSELAGVSGERRIFRQHHFPAARVRFAQLEISAADGAFPTVREIEFGGGEAKFPEWIVVVNATHEATLPGHGQEFIPLARKAGAANLPAQQVWLTSFDEEFLRAEPRPLCAFISGSFKDWCEVRRADFRGMAGVLKSARLPIWASCGGAQALAIIAEHGVDQAWDCPHCRDPKNPKTPIYTHIGHTGQKPCGDYSACEFERGPHQLRQINRDGAFAGLDEEFTAIQSHCGEIAYMPAGWTWLIGPGPGARTQHQAFKMDDRPIYAAQFHIEMEGAPETSATIMRNFLQIAREWGGYKAAP